jgi:hypothetical protein
MPADKFETWLNLANPRYSPALLPPHQDHEYEPSGAVAEFSTAVTQPLTTQVEPVRGLSTAAAAIAAVNIAPEPA